MCERGLTGVPLALTLGLDAGAVDQQIQRTHAATVRDSHVQLSLAATQCTEVRHGPVQTDQPQKALHEARRLPQWHAEQYFQG